MALGTTTDMIVTADGASYGDNLGMHLVRGGPTVGWRLLRIWPDGTVSAAAEGLPFPNRIVLP